jgi:hypothetical protein
MVLWTYLAHVLPQGGGQPHLDKVFGHTDIDWRGAVDILMELELVEQVELVRGGNVYRSSPPDVDAKGKLADGPVPTLKGAVAIIAESYQLWREDQGFRRWTPTPSDERKWESLLVWLRTHKAEFKEYADYAHALYKPISAVAIPMPSHLAGPYAQGNWLNRSSAGPMVKATTARKAHAGSDYRPSKAIKRRLMELGVDVTDMDSSQLRYVDELAQALAVDPDMPVPSRWAGAVTALTGDHLAAPA